MSKKMRSVHRFPFERYACPNCEHENLDELTVDRSWRCPDCNNFIWIYAGYSVPDDEGIYVRKRADEVNRNERMKPNSSDETYRVLGINQLESGKLGFGLEGFGQFKREKDDCVTLRVGGVGHLSW